MDTAKATALLKQAQAGITSLQQVVADALAQLAPDPAPVAPAPTPAKPAGRVPENITGLVAGLDRRYYEVSVTKLPDFSKLTPTSQDVVLTPTLDGRKRNDNFAYVYTGYIYAPTDGKYTFFTSSDDGSKLYIGSDVVVDNDGGHSVQERSGEIALQKGYHPIRTEYFDYTGDQALTVSWSGPGFAKQAIPAAAYFRVATPAKAIAEAAKPPTAKATVTDFTVKTALK